jgi:hypothetical protein
MAESIQIHNFVHKLKVPPLKVDVAPAEGKQAGFNCTIALGPAFADGQGFPEMSFSDSARSKKAAKAAAMKKAHAFLAQQPIFQHTLQAMQTSKPQVRRCTTYMIDLAPVLIAQCALDASGSSTLCACNMCLVAPDVQVKIVSRSALLAPHSARSCTHATSRAA